MTSRREIERRLSDLEESDPGEDSAEAIQAAMWEALTDYCDR